MPHRMTETQMLREAVIGALSQGSRRDPIIVACHILHVKSYVAMIRRRLEGEGVVSLKFVMREDDLKDPVVIKEYEEEQKSEVAACLDSLAGLRSLLMGTDPTGHSA